MIVLSSQNMHLINRKNRGENDDKQVVILGRIVTWTEKGIEYKADAKHREIIMDHFGFNDKTED